MRYAFINKDEHFKYKNNKGTIVYSMLFIYFKIAKTIFNIVKNIQLGILKYNSVFLLRSERKNRNDNCQKSGDLLKQNEN